MPGPTFNFILANFPALWNGTPKQLAEQIVACLEAEIPEGLMPGGYGAQLPTSDIGPFMLTTDHQWYVWDSASNQYILQTTQDRIGEIAWFGHVPDSTKWALCDGLAVPRNGQFAVLYSRIGTTFGTGDGSTTFNKPDARGRALIGAGQGGGLTLRTLGQQVGAETHILTGTELPTVDAAAATKNLASGAADGLNQSGVTGHNNMQPSLVANPYIRYA